MVGNGVSTIVVARWEHELSLATLRQNMALPFEAATAVATPVAPTAEPAFTGASGTKP